MQPSVEKIEELATAPLLSGAPSPLARYAHLLDGPDALPPPRLPQDFRDGALSFGVLMFLRYRTVKADRLDAAMARLDARLNTPATRASARFSNSLNN